MKKPRKGTAGKMEDTRPQEQVQTSPQPITRLTREQIAARAYKIYRARGCAPGQELDDWLQAERELKKELRASA